ncbi:hypothetical protein BGZ95_004619 [Linnemannia exigua]|uniref:Secreted protein n=1 Tax=Linnemannia exigua TaxID=604196 RepID=A0AAD4D3A7_9FUNG|nr:hypothetical protein BGZ95_004619 [Linnemannia exigua]
MKLLTCTSIVLSAAVSCALVQAHPSKQQVCSGLIDDIHEVLPRVNADRFTVKPVCPEQHNWERLDKALGCVHALLGKYPGKTNCFPEDVTTLTKCKELYPTLQYLQGKAQDYVAKACVSKQPK